MPIEPYPLTAGQRFRRRVRAVVTVLIDMLVLMMLIMGCPLGETIALTPLAHALVVMGGVLWLGLRLYWT